jgi:hypothetical protein
VSVAPGGDRSDVIDAWRDTGVLAANELLVSSDGTRAWFAVGTGGGGAVSEVDLRTLTRKDSAAPEVNTLTALDGGIVFGTTSGIRALNDNLRAALFPARAGDEVLRIVAIR